MLFLQEDIGTGLFQQRYCKLEDSTLKQVEIGNFGVNSKLMKNFEILNGNPMTGAQLSLYTIIGRYIDLYAAGLKIDSMVLFSSLFLIITFLSSIYIYVKWTEGKISYQSSSFELEI